jgi:hypothetical protein
MAEKGDILLFRSKRPGQRESPAEKAECPLFRQRVPGVSKKWKVNTKKWIAVLVPSV